MLYNSGRRTGLLRRTFEPTVSGHRPVPQGHPGVTLVFLRYTRCFSDVPRRSKRVRLAEQGAEDTSHPQPTPGCLMVFISGRTKSNQSTTNIETAVMFAPLLLNKEKTWGEKNKTKQSMGPSPVELEIDWGHSTRRVEEWGRAAREYFNRTEKTNLAKLTFKTQWGWQSWCCGQVVDSSSTTASLSPGSGLDLRSGSKG